jgi:serine/threonine protein kinase/tetratricopeptide (TPR) repeat protein
MNPEQWQRIKEVFFSALDRSPDSRAQYLSEACADDTSLLGQVEALIASHEETDSFIDGPMFQLDGEQVARCETPMVEGQGIGPYQIVREIGRGGMGTVYLAARADRTYQKEVAIKVVRRGLAADLMIRRFLDERQILASLDHPNIARLLDGGATEDGLPYFVMEYIEGVPIDEYCDGRHLPTIRRLELFRSVCAAVHDAHRNLVIHRDIKPGNILVNADGAPKLLDFGIAKILNPDLSHRVGSTTQPIHRLLTPEYASPEQVRGEAITTASDVYSLGVLLYELLTGHRPYPLNGKTPPEVYDVICHQEPARPSEAVTRAEEVAGPDGRICITPDSVSLTRDGHVDKLRRRLKGDVDNIVLKALRKEPQRRYPSVNEFSEDIRRHLEGRTVTAHRDSLGYRAGKFVRRHRAGVAGGALLLLTLIGGLAATVWQAHIAGLERDLAFGAAKSMIYELADGLKKMVGPTESRIGLLTQAAKTLDGITAQQRPSVEMKRMRADCDRVLAQTYHLLGDPSKALERATTAEQFARELTTQPGGALQDKALLGSILMELGDIFSSVRRPADATAAYDESLSLLEQVGQSPEASADAIGTWSLCLTRKGDRLYDEGRLNEAGDMYSRSLRVIDGVVNRNGGVVRYRAILGTILERLGDISFNQGKEEECCQRYTEMLEVRKGSRDIEPDDPDVLRGYSLSMQYVGWCAEKNKRMPEAMGLYEESIQIQRHLLSSDPANARYVANLMGGLGTMGNATRTAGDMPSAIDWYRQAMRVGSAFCDKGLVDIEVDKKMAEVAALLSQALVKQKQLAEASEALRSSMRILEELHARDAQNLEYRRLLADNAASQGSILFAERKLNESLDFYRKALSIRKEVSATTGASDDLQFQAVAYYDFGRILKQMSRPYEAHQALTQGERILLDLRDAGQLSESSDGAREYLPAIQKALEKRE